MKSRRNEDYHIQADPKLKFRDRGVELGHYSYAISRRDLMDGSPRARRSLSPGMVEGTRRLLDVNGRSSSVERRDHGWDLGAGRGARVRSRSPPTGTVHGSQYEEGFASRDLVAADSRRRYEFADYVDMNDDATPGLKPEYRYQHMAARLTREELDSSRFLGSGGNKMSNQKLMISEDAAEQHLFRLPRDFGPASKFGEGDVSYPSSSANQDLGRFKDGRIKYPDPSLVDNKLAVTESYREREKPIFYSRDVLYSRLQVSESKNGSGTSQFKDFADTSSGISRANLQELYQDGKRLLVDDYPRSSGKVTEPLSFNDYGQRSILDSGRDCNTEYFPGDTFSPTRVERPNNLNPRSLVRNRDDYGYLSDESYRRFTREKVDYNYKDLLRRDMRDSIAEYADNTEYAYRNPLDNSYVDHPALKKQMVSNYFDESVSTTSKGRQYLDSGSSHIEYDMRVSREQAGPHLGVSKDHEISRLVNYGFERDAGAASFTERMRVSPEFKYETEMDRLAVRAREISSEELGTFDSSDRSLKRKYIADAEMSKHNSRNIVPGKWYNSSRPRDLTGSSKKWIVQDSSFSNSSRSFGYDKKLYHRVERTFSGADQQRSSASEDWLPPPDYSDEHEHSVKPYKPGGRYSKGYHRSGPLSSFNSHRAVRGNVLPKPHNVWIRGNDNNQVDILENEVEQSDDWVRSARSEPPEDSEEFNQLVHKAFLIFSKKLNENPAARKRYKEQGRAGSLFCIVCGRSQSKDFLDTQRLVRHAFMSHKIGLRAQHLGLQKAVCVLLGWNSVVSPDVITWVPEAVPDAEARAQKEDLILWPPVVIIQNSSITENNVEGQKAITVEALGDSLRGKGFSGGKFKACLGKPANHSVIVVKFLGTFSGLQDAERLHRYFVENNRGRADFERLASSKGKASSNIGVQANQGHNAEELVLYGYMGIAEDLDKVDMETKRKSLIKSKKEIQDLANAPVKPERGNL